ncbi:surfactin synthase thioesterase subunit [Mobilisporobacter senegalensis]|uniref:Surfactin synthase thioesterase subunit n=1 Tax=Mobilisporobacter senegalensis TaxID=1329262 RepID=A0A3N1XGL6_9FIRM|nr:thioesterase domain-containing protein [Mobilisporobacter senegalensis]ROR25859.1 surfactin synthase thioesterase subunit [Mobilisporobacter senegalensis]
MDKKVFDRRREYLVGRGVSEISKIKVFPIPYAGASVNVYYGWKELLPDRYELCMIELAGRGTRFGEPYYQSVDEASDDIAKRISEQLKYDDEYVIFGHSMGALLTYEIYYKLKQIGIREPRHLFVSGRNAPHSFNKRDNIENMTNENFLQMVEEYGGIPEEFYIKEIMEIFLPILRADFIILDRYKFQPKVEKISCGTSIFYAADDFSTHVEKIRKWTEVIEDHVKFHKFKGEHFFLNRYPNDIVNFIVKDTETRDTGA